MEIAEGDLVTARWANGKHVQGTIVVISEELVVLENVTEGARIDTKPEDLEKINTLVIDCSDESFTGFEEWHDIETIHN